MPVPFVTRTTLGTPTGFAGVDLGPGTGTLPAGTYYYRITAFSGSASYPAVYAPVRSAPATEITVVVAAGTSSVSLTWNAVAGAQGYIIWRTTVSGNYTHTWYDAYSYPASTLRPSALSYTSTGTAYTDTGAIAPACGRAACGISGFRMLSLYGRCRTGTQQLHFQWSIATSSVCPPGGRTLHGRVTPIWGMCTPSTAVSIVMRRTTGKNPATPQPGYSRAGGSSSQPTQ